METLGPPIILLAAIWGAFNVIFRALELMTDRRDLFHGFKNASGMSSKTNISVKRHYFLDWLPIWLGVMLFQLIFAVIIFFVPELITTETSKPTELVRWLCKILAVFPTMGFIAFLVGGVYDIQLFMRSMNDDD